MMSHCCDLEVSIASTGRLGHGSSIADGSDIVETFAINAGMMPVLLRSWSKLAGMSGPSPDTCPGWLARLSSLVRHQVYHLDKREVVLNSLVTESAVPILAVLLSS